VTNLIVPGAGDSRIDKLRAEIREHLPNSAEWLSTPHELLGGDSPEHRLKMGDVDSVENLVKSILYIGIS
jgi:hypothetical protein